MEGKAVTAISFKFIMKKVLGEIHTCMCLQSLTVTEIRNLDLLKVQDQNRSKWTVVIGFVY